MEYYKIDPESALLAMFKIPSNLSHIIRDYSCKRDIVFFIEHIHINTDVMQLLVARWQLKFK
jgi:hypothetical protein